MNERQLRAIWEKTSGHCHFCGDRLDLSRRGHRAGGLDGRWEVDHLVQRAKGGTTDPENCLPACTRCNRLRWHRSGADVRRLLFFGLVATHEIERMSVIGKELIRLAHAREFRNSDRTASGSSTKGRRNDPVRKEELAREDRRILIAFLRKHHGRSFRAMELSRGTGIPKIRVRPALEGRAVSVDVVREGRTRHYVGRAPKSPRRTSLQD